MTIAVLLQTLNSLNITLGLQDESLKITAPKGVITKELQEQLKEHKADLLTWLKQKGGKEEVELPTVIHDPSGYSEPFPLLDLQTGFLMADDDYMEFHVRPHYYLELDRDKYLDIHRYEQAWNRALEYHQGSLVTVNSVGQLQLLENVPGVAIKVNDLRDLPSQEAEQRLLAIRHRLKRQELPLDRFPWFELQVSYWQSHGQEKSRVHYNNNNFFSDGFGTNKLIQLVDNLYQTESQELKPLQINLRDISRAFSELADSPLGQRAKAYWLDRLEDLPSAPEIPQVTGKNRRCRASMARRQQIISAQRWSSFKHLASKHGLTPSNAITAAYAELISAWSQSDHFILNHMVTRRFPMHPDISQMVGNFASLYPLEIDLRKGHTFVDRAKITQQRITEDMDHLHWGGMQVLQALNQLSGELGRSPCPFVISSGLFMKGFKETAFSCLETAQTLLDHQFWEFDDGRCIYVWDLMEDFFPPGVIDDMWQAYQEFIDRLADDEAFWQHRRHNFVPQQQLDQRAEINNTVVTKPTGLLQQYLERSAEKFPSAKSVVTPNESLTYRELHQKSATIAHVLRENSVAVNELVAVVLPRNTDLVASVYGILMAGAAYVPVDSSLPEGRIQYLLENSKARFVITNRAIDQQHQWPASIAGVILTEDTLDTSLPTYPQPAVIQDTNDLAYVIYTSGSTGNPKGVMIDHLGAMNTIGDINRRFNVNHTDRIFGVSSFSFDLSVYDLFGPIATGATLIYPEPEQSLNPAHWIEVMYREKITVWNSAPPLMQLLVDAAIRENIQLPELRLVMLSGDWIPLNLPQLIKQVAPKAQVISLGGATEASIWSIYFPIQDVRPEWQSIPYGFPLDNQSWHILDDHLRPVPDWTAGHLYIGGIGLAQGYWQDKEKTERSFISHPETGERIYRTGDLGRYTPDGYIEFLGRSDFQVKIQGFRIELGEIETALLNHREVNEAVVVANNLENSRDKRLVSYVVLQNKPQDQETEQAVMAELQSFIGKKLPEYMVPGIFSFLEAMPLSSNGKINRKALPDVDFNEVDVQTPFVAPRNRIEKELASIWSEVLDVQKEIGIADDFFDLGGRSFDAVRITAFIKERLGIAISMATIWERRTIERIAAILARSDAQETQILLTLKSDGEELPLFMVHPAGGHVIAYLELARHLHGPVYGLQAVGLDDGQAPQQTIEDMAEHYLSEIYQQQGNKPFAIGGWSSGGIIAFEMMRRLETAGRVSPPLVLVDTPSPIEEATPEAEALLAWFIEDLNLNIPVEKLQLASLVNQPAAIQLQECFAQIRSFSSLPLDLSVDQLLPIYEVFKSVICAGRQYQAQTISSDITLIRAADGRVSEFTTHPNFNASHWGWPELTTGAVDVLSVSGTHYSILNSPNVEAIAKQINTNLAKFSKPVENVV